MFSIMFNYVHIPFITSVVSTLMRISAIHCIQSLCDRGEEAVWLLL